MYVGYVRRLCTFVRGNWSTTKYLNFQEFLQQSTWIFVNPYNTFFCEFSGHLNSNTLLFTVLYFYKDVAKWKTFYKDVAKVRLKLILLTCKRENSKTVPQRVHNFTSSRGEQHLGKRIMEGIMMMLMSSRQWSCMNPWVSFRFVIDLMSLSHLLI